MNFETFKCEGPCGLELPRTNKHFRKDKKQGTYRRVCKKCEALLRRQYRAFKGVRYKCPKVWTMLYNSKLRSQLYATKTSVNGLPPYTLLAIMRLQRNSDYITQFPFRLPEGQELVAFTSWKEWLKSLPKEDRDRTPLLVRIVGGREGKWVPGNVVFVTAMCGDTIEYFGGFKEARDTCRMIADSDLRIAQTQQIDEEIIRLTNELERSGKEI